MTPSVITPSDEGASAGVLVSSSPPGWWAWTGLRLEPAAAGADHGGYPGFPEEQRRVEATSREHAWLAEQWTRTGQYRFEIRYSNVPGADPGRVRCVILSQVYGGDRAAVEAAAVALRERLSATPRHVRAEPLSDTDDVHRALMPMAARPGGLAEVRKRLSWAWTTRRDTRFPVGVVVSSLGGGEVSWEPVWDELARQKSPTMIGVCLEPWTAGEGLRSRIGLLAQEYGRLAVPGTPNPVFRQPVLPDPFAVRAAPLFQDAAHRYADRTYRQRITIAAEGSLPLRLAELVTSILSQPSSGPYSAAVTLGEGNAAVVRVPPPEEYEAAWGNVIGLNRTWLDKTYRQGVPPGRLGQTEQILCDLVDLQEATAAFRFPYEIPGHPPLFDTADRGTAYAAPVEPQTSTGSRGDPNAPAF